MCHSSAYAAVKDLLAEEEREQRAGKARATERRRGEGIRPGRLLARLDSAVQRRVGAPASNGGGRT